jgi:hypothetical protein
LESGYPPSQCQAPEIGFRWPTASTSIDPRGDAVSRAAADNSRFLPDYEQPALALAWWYDLALFKCNTYYKRQVRTSFNETLDINILLLYAYSTS